MHFTHSSSRSQSDKEKCQLINKITMPYLMAQMEPCTYATKQRLIPIWEPEADLLVSVSQITLSVPREVGATQNHIQFYISKYLKL